MNGAVSRVVAQHESGAMVTIPRYFADTVITEHGVARLWGKNHRQRAEELIAERQARSRDPERGLAIGL